MVLIVISSLAAILFELSLRFLSPSLEWRARVVESVFAAIIGLLAVTSLVVHQMADLAVADGLSFIGIKTLYITMGFFLYHLHRVIFVPGYTSSLIAHHLGMILVITASLSFQIAQFYILLASVPISSAAIRNFRWFWKQSGRPRWYAGALAAAATYVFLESAPPLLGLFHFFLIGIHKMILPYYLWIGLVAPGIILSLMTFYWSVKFVSKTMAGFRKAEDVAAISQAA